MIVLDTNVVSEPLRPEPSPAVVAWLDAQVLETLFLATLTLAELRFGVAILPPGKRKDALNARLEDDVLPLFSGRILTFDETASVEYAVLRARARRQGADVGVTDGYIAAIAHARGFTMATRDTAPFVACGVPVIDPFEPVA